MRHIFCGEIVTIFEAVGFHSLSTATNWQTCAIVQQCQTFPNGNSYCNSVYIYNSPQGSYVPKLSSSTLWPTTRSPVQLVPMFQILYNCCPPATNYAALCYSNCHWMGNANGFDIVIRTEYGAIVIAYPAQQGTCTGHPGWQDCNPIYCQQL